MQGVNFDGDTLGNQFKNFDTNKDGVLDWSEVWNMMHPLEHAMKEKDYAWEMTPTMTSDEFHLMVRQIFDVSDHDKN